MDINWFPGHMTKSMRMIDENLKLIDVVVYTLDARAPRSCMNPSFDELIAGLPKIYILNKADLASVTATSQWTDKLSTDNSRALSLDGTASKSTSKLVSEMRNVCRDKLERAKAKGIRKSIKAMVIGVPNCGKSTIINNLCGSAKTVTGNKAGVTRGKQWVRINDYLEVLDTPGTLYPKLVNQTIAKRLAFIGSIRDEVVDTFELALNLIQELNLIDVNIIMTRYNIEINGGESAENILNKVATKRGFLMRGGEVDSLRCSAAIVDDFRKGRMGRITLELAE